MTNADKCDAVKAEGQKQTYLKPAHLHLLEKGAGTNVYSGMKKEYVEVKEGFEVNVLKENNINVSEVNDKIKEQWQWCESADIPEDLLDLVNGVTEASAVENSLLLSNDKVGEFLSGGGDLLDMSGELGKLLENFKKR